MNYKDLLSLYDITSSREFKLIAKMFELYYHSLNDYQLNILNGSFVRVLRKKLTPFLCTNCM